MYSEVFRVEPFTVIFHRPVCPIRLISERSDEGPRSAALSNPEHFLQKSGQRWSCLGQRQGAVQLVLLPIQYGSVQEPPNDNDKSSSPKSGTFIEAMGDLRTPHVCLGHTTFGLNFGGFGVYVPGQPLAFGQVGSTDSKL